MTEPQQLRDQAKADEARDREETARHQRMLELEQRLERAPGGGEFLRRVKRIGRAV